MDFKDDVQLDSSQVENAGRGGGFPGGGLAVGGGAAGIIALILAVIFGINPGNITGGSDEPAPTSAGTSNTQCKEGRDADASQDCRLVGTVNSVQKYWATAVQDYQPANTVSFQGQVQTGCGAADTSVGPFYCPTDKKVYLDMSFFQVLQDQLGAKNTPFVEAYVVAHEYGHHVQDLLGDLAKSQGDQQGADSGSVRVELQADCYAGAWAKNGYETGFFEKEFTDTEIKEALDAAAAIGDDAIQQKGQGQVNPDTFTHGTSAQRVKWFTTGYQSGDPKGCDTFSGSI